MPERFSSGWPSTLQSAPSASPEGFPHCKAKDTSTWSTSRLPPAATPDALACAPCPRPYPYGSSDGNDQKQSCPPPPAHSPSSRQCRGPKYPGPRPLSSGQQPSLDRSLHEVPRLVPTDPQNPSRSQDVTLPKYIDRQPLKQQREPRPLLGPRQPPLPYPMLSAVNPRRAAMKKRLELTTVQMTPRSLRSMVIQRCQGSTFRTGPTDLSRMGRPHIHPLILQIQRHPFHRPRFFNPQQVTVQFSVLHGSSPPWSHFTLNYHPLKTRKNQIF